MNFFAQEFRSVNTFETFISVHISQFEKGNGKNYIVTRECANTLLDLNKFEKQTSAAKSADSSNSDRSNSPKAGGNVRRLAKRR